MAVLLSNQGYSVSQIRELINSSKKVVTEHLAVHMDKRTGPEKTLDKMRVVPAILSINHEEDKRMRINGYSHQEVRRYRAARLPREAYAQKRVLTQADIAELIGTSAGTIGKDI